MIIKAHQKYIRVSPRKMRLTVNAVRKLTPGEALEQLAFIRKAAAPIVAKVIKQAIANANNEDLKEQSLEFKSIQVDEGPTFKRWRAVSRGRAHSIMKRTSHLTVLLETTNSEVKKNNKNSQNIVEKKKVKKQPKKVVKKANKRTDKR